MRRCFPVANGKHVIADFMDGVIQPAQSFGDAPPGDGRPVLRRAMPGSPGLSSGGEAAAVAGTANWRRRIKLPANFSASHRARTAAAMRLVM